MSAVDILPLSTSAYISDTQHLSLPQHGAYLLILMTMWRAGGWIDDDDLKLANICKLSPAKWRKIADPVRALLIARDGRLSQKRLLSEIQNELKRVSQNRQNGSAGGKAKALKSQTPHLATAKVSPAGRQSPEVRTTLPFLDEEDSKKISRKGSRGTSLSGDWQPTASDVAYGRQLGLSEPEIAMMAEDMRLWARANANRQVGRKADWTATFHGWMRREKGRRRTGSSFESRSGAPAILARMYEDGGPTDGDEALEDRPALPAR